MKTDTYSQARGGWSRMLDISCDNCGEHLCYYQKDGPGPLKRMYIDRMTGAPAEGANLVCGSCGFELGIKTVYQKEARPAYRLFQSSVKKKVIKQSSVKS